MCSQPTNSPKSTRPNPTWPNSTSRVGSVFRGWWVGLGYANFFNNGSGWVWVITITNFSNPTRPTYIFKIYIIYIIINNFLFIPLSTASHSYSPTLLLLVYNWVGILASSCIFCLSTQLDIFCLKLSWNTSSCIFCSLTQVISEIKNFFFCSI